jgi:hypothetical protein
MEHGSLTLTVVHPVSQTATNTNLSKTAHKKENQKMTTVQFEAWPKTARLFRDMIVTEKIDGTNAAIQIIPTTDVDTDDLLCLGRDEKFAVFAQSRTRLIAPGPNTDNYEFAAWVQEHAETLIRDLGPGIHYGEWWGKGIQRGYDVEERYFALFSSKRMGKDGYFETPNLMAVPVLARRTFSQDVIEEILRDLRENGSHVNRDFKNPEGIIVYHAPTKTTTKVTLDNQDKGKWELES